MLLRMLVEATGLLASIVGLVAAARPTTFQQLKVRTVTALACLGLATMLVVQRCELERIAGVSHRTETLLDDRDLTPDEIHAALGDVPLADVNRALVLSRDRGSIADSLMELRDPNGRFVRTRVYFRRRE